MIRLDDHSIPIAEVNRRVGAYAERIGLSRPSYEQVRVHVHTFRSFRRRPGMAQVLLDVAFRVRPVDAILDHLAGTDTPPSK